VLTNPIIYGGLWGWEGGFVLPKKSHSTKFRHVKKAAQRSGSYPQTLLPIFKLTEEFEQQNLFEFVAHFQGSLH
jgi:hypothetical protein